MSLRGQQLGIPTTVTKLLTTFLEQVKYYIATGNGISELFNTCDELYMYGSGQGARWSPHTQLFQLITMIKIFVQQVMGFTTKLPHLNNARQRVIDLFVDDAVKWLNYFLQSVEVDTIVEDITKIAQQWEKIYIQKVGSWN
ncbi:hypothetical protein TI05_13575 [Achromatium sp. WMS3]|nr:hypothetical protein TI03_02440 [Achromatium sp. WMS1]KOR29569.1 hypothetical protein TI04_08290 [Achromatium sp. WMS2]KOR30675.1 hypothetical protein TI05_13575 [Achromatium sp. WMS3]